MTSQRNCGTRCRADRPETPKLRSMATLSQPKQIGAVSRVPTAVLSARCAWTSNATLPSSVSPHTHTFTFIASSSTHAVAAFIVGTFAAPSRIPELERRASPIGISASDAKSYLSQRECLHPRFLIMTSKHCIFRSDGRYTIQLPRIQKDIFPHLDHR